MRLLLCLFFLWSLSGFGQKASAGLIVKFQEEVSFAEKKEVLAHIDQLKPLEKEHDLSGFGVCLVQGTEVFTEEEYHLIRTSLETYEEVEFTSLFFRTAEGGFGGDLQDLYLRPKDHKTFNPSSVSLVVGAAVKKHDYLEDVYVYHFDKNSISIRAAQQELIATGNYEFVVVNTLHSLLVTSDDPYFEHQWALENTASPLHYDGIAGADMSVPEAWELSTGDPSIKIAVLDAGTDTNHVDLADNLLPGFDATGGESNGYPNTTYSSDGHGTCSAGIVAASGDNGEGIAGVAYDCKIIPVKIFYYIYFAGEVIPFTTAEAGMDGMNWAVNTAKADILSNSWGIRDSDIPLLGIDTVMGNMVIADAVANGREGKGTPMLFSSGNEGDNFSIWPAILPKTISVGASTMCDELKTPSDCSPEGWWGSNYGAGLDVVAPGVKVITTDMTGSLGYNDFIDDDYAMFNGTSAACPNAAGVMALILSVAPGLSAFDARGVLSITADKTGDYTYDEPKGFGMWSDEMGYGRVNAYEAVYYASNYVGIQEEARQKSWVGYENGKATLFLNDSGATKLVVYSVAGAEVARLENLSSNAIDLTGLIEGNGMFLIHIRGEYPYVLKAFIQQ